MMNCCLFRNKTVNGPFIYKIDWTPPPQKNDKGTTVLHWKIVWMFLLPTDKSQPEAICLCVWPTVQFKPLDTLKIWLHKFPVATHWARTDNGIRQMSSLCLQREAHDVLVTRQYTRINGLFLMHGWNHIWGWKEAFNHKNTEARIISHWRPQPNLPEFHQRPCRRFFSP